MIMAYWKKVRQASGQDIQFVITDDDVFSLHALTEILKAKKQKLFCSFIDFIKAFDSVILFGEWDCGQSY